MREHKGLFAKPGTFIHTCMYIVCDALNGRHTYTYVYTYGGNRWAVVLTMNASHNGGTKYYCSIGMYTHEDACTIEQ